MNVALRPQLRAQPVAGPRILSLCTGGGGLDLGLELAMPSARVVCMVEREAFAVAHLVAAMRAGLLAPAPVWSDARTFSGRAWRDCLDGLIGGIPCQPHSLAGKRLGADDERDLWSPARRIIVQSRPWFVLIENVRGMLSSGADEDAGAERVRGGLRRLGFEVEGGLFTAEEVGFPQERERIFILGVSDALSDTFRTRLQGSQFGEPSGAVDGQPAPRPAPELRPARFPPGPRSLSEWTACLAQEPGLEPEICRTADGMASALDAVRMLGNGVVPLQAAYALRTLAARLARRSAGAGLLVRMMADD